MTPSVVSFADLLASAVTEPGIISTAYSAFHGYSIGNQLLALAQCAERGITPGPISTFMGWKDKGRYVRKGEKAIVLCMPITAKRKAEARPDADTGDDSTPGTFTRFVFRPNWFVLAQTAGQDLPPVSIPAWDCSHALQALDVAEVPFDATDGNVMGFARARTIAVSPLNPLPHKTRFHELAHVLLGHTSEGEQGDGERVARSLRECEAEAVALLCCAALDLPGEEFARGYIQGWWGAGNPIPERSAQKVLKVADQILKAGTTTADDAQEVR